MLIRGALDQVWRERFKSGGMSLAFRHTEEAGVLELPLTQGKNKAQSVERCRTLSCLALDRRRLGQKVCSLCERFLCFQAYIPATLKPPHANAIKRARMVSRSWRCNVSVALQLLHVFGQPRGCCRTGEQSRPALRHQLDPDSLWSAGTIGRVLSDHVGRRQLGAALRQCRKSGRHEARCQAGQQGCRHRSRAVATVLIRSAGHHGQRLRCKGVAQLELAMRSC
jgi:hypothetical protein